MEGFLNPNEILKQLDLKKEMVAADFGSGSGGWAIPLAKILKDGKVYAIDILEEPLSALKNKSEIEGINNIEIVRADVEGDKDLIIQDNVLDLVLITNLLFQAENKNTIFQRAKRILKRGGRILLIEWKLEASLGPKSGKISSKEVKELAKKNGLRVGEEIEAGNYDYGLILEKT